MPPGFAAAAVIPQRPVRMVAARDPGQKVAAIKAIFEPRKFSKLDASKLVPVSKDVALEKFG